MIGAGSFTRPIGGGFYLFSPPPVGSEYELVGVVIPSYDLIGRAVRATNMVGLAEDEFELNFKIQQAQ